MKRSPTTGYPLRLDRRDKADVNRVAKETGESINSILVLSIRKGLPLARAALVRPSDRVTLVDPLPEDVVRLAYSLSDECEKVSNSDLLKFQSQQEPD